MEKHVVYKILLSILLSLIVAFSFARTTEDETEMVSILVLKRKLDVGSVITNEYIEVEEMELEFQERYFPNVFFEDQRESLLGNVAIQAHYTGEPFELDDSKIGFKEENIAQLESIGKVDKSTLIPYDMRVISVTVDQSGSMNKTLEKGSYVDVIYSSSSSSTGGSYSRMVMQHAKIFDIHDIESSSNRVAQEIMLLVSPREATIIASAKRNGVIDLVLNPINGRVKQMGPIFTNSFANYSGYQANYVDDFKTVFSYLVQNEDFKRIVRFRISANFTLEKFDDMIQSLSFDEFDLKALYEYMEESK